MQATPSRLASSVPCGGTFNTFREGCGRPRMRAVLCLVLALMRSHWSRNRYAKGLRRFCSVLMLQS